VRLRLNFVAFIKSIYKLREKIWLIYVIPNLSSKILRKNIILNLMQGNKSEPQEHASKLVKLPELKEKILDLELKKKILLSEEEILWDEVHAVQRDLDYLKSIQK